MIHYALLCGGGHEFDGWFPDSAGFERQAARGLIECPVCAGTVVTRALMAPRVQTSRAPLPAPEPKAAPSDNPVAAPASAPPMVAAAPMPAEVRALLQRMRAEVERGCDYVGSDFAVEARRIHRGNAPPRSIYGETSAAEAEALAEEGIEVSRIPWVPRADG